jgi:hypothetical protein
MSCLVGLEQMQELNISGCTGIDAKTVATVVAQNRTLSALILGDIMGGPATLEIGVTEADFSDKNLGIKGAIIISAWITHKDKGAISTAVVNTFPLPIQDIKSKAELDFSGKELTVEDIIIIAALIPSNVSHKPYPSLLLSLISLSVTRGR